MSRNKYILFIALLLTTTVVIAWHYWQTPFTDSRYRLLRVERGDVKQAVSANGTLNPVVLVNVGTQVSGVMLHLHADFNDHVTAGQVLAELDPTLFQAQLGQSQANVANAKAALRLAQSNEKRIRTLFERNYISRAELDQSVEALEVARAQVALAEAQMRRDQTNKRFSVIVSPVSGVVVSRNSVEIMRLFDELNRQQGITVVLVTHEADIARYAQRLIRVVDGRIAQDGPTAQLLGSPHA